MRSTPLVEPREPGRDRPFHFRGAALPLIFLVLAGTAALAIDLPRDAYSPKSDESTYVAMALSLAKDGNLTYERADLTRFWEIYGTGPQGIFLKRGSRPALRASSHWPFISVVRRPATDRLFFGKPLLYAIAAVPFVWLAGLNGLALMNVCLLAAMIWSGVRALRPASEPGAAVLFASAFFGASVVLIYAAWLTPEILNCACAFFAYRLWTSAVWNDAVGARGRRWRLGAALVLLGLLTYSKPPYALLVGPLFAWALFKRRVLEAFVIGALSASVAAGMFGLNALVTGEANYQGGDRKTFYGQFPFDAPDGTFATRGLRMTTNDVDSPFASGFLPMLGANSIYFLVGRDFGFVPYFFPGVVVIAVFLRRRQEHAPARWMILAGVAGSALALLLLVPTSWSGGGGPPGNRYFLPVYCTLFFLSGRAVSRRAGLLAWLGGVLFIGQMLTSPLAAARFTYTYSQEGLLRALPVELTMINDLPIGLAKDRARVPYSANGQQMLLYLLDDQAYPPEGDAFWVRGGGRADVIVRTGVAFDRLHVTLTTPIANTVRISAGGGSRTLQLDRDVRYELQLPARTVAQVGGSVGALLQIRPSRSFVPHLVNPPSGDGRALGVLVRVSPVPATGVGDGQ